MDTPIRRVVTVHDPQGKAYFASDELLTPYDPKTAPEFSIPDPDSGFGVVQTTDRAASQSTTCARTLLSHHRPPAEQGWMHRTLSLDYFVVLSGTVGIITDGGVEKILEPHDVVVCRGTNHDKEIVTVDGVRLEKTPAGPIYDPPEK
ncbi:hypothetical protein PENDEC_c014G06056 [Penicillium decumbens]|uniref:Uncharacterized protein n=1 Tax=Penicillium decumbens TaxID=69771 RepID=A0A1V6P9J8_PENDC|nr:hypothetical protein PENDEC_c014G06056 [Penicillium decumbens]